MKNAYEIRGDVTAIFIKYEGQIIETLISTSKLERACEFEGKWRGIYSKHTDSVYVLGELYFGGRSKGVFLHRWLIDAKDGLQVDHLNHNTLDNTDGNLQEVTPSVNRQNRKGLQSNNTSGYRGVSYDRHNKRWRASCRLNGKFGY